MVKVTYKSKANEIIKVWFETTDEACQYVKTILWNAVGYVKVQAFEEVTEK